MLIAQHLGLYCIRAGAGQPLLTRLRRALFAIALAAPLASPAAQTPSIVYILADDLGAKDMGFRGGQAQTPHLDKLAEGGTVLNQFYVQPHSTQTRAALLTGRYPMRYGLQTQSILPSSQYGLPSDERTLAQTLKEAGYHTAFIGKWQLGHAKPEFLPGKRGFDYFYGSLAGNVEYTLKKGAKNDWRRMEQAAKDEGYVTTLLGKDAANWIATQDGGKPFFLLLAFAAPQGQPSAPPAMLAKYASETDEARRNYLGAISALDEAVGAVLAALESKKWTDKTLIVFHSDNGGAVLTRFATGDGDVKKTVANNDVLREGRGSLYEGGVRTPAILHWPQKVWEKTTLSDMAHVTDLYPTLVKLAGANAEQAKKPDGIDLWPMLAEKQAGSRKEVLINAEDLRGALRVGEWKLVVHAALPSRIELFQLSNDPEEAENRAERETDRVKDLLKRLNEYAYDMAPAKYLEELGKPHSAEIPIYWGHNPARK